MTHNKKDLDWLKNCPEGYTREIWIDSKELELGILKIVHRETKNKI